MYQGLDSEADVKERGILFSAEMVRAVLEDRKTQTRRLVKPQPRHPHATKDEGIWGDTSDPVTRYFACPYGRVGDRLWVRETFRLSDTTHDCACYEPCHCRSGVPIYRADGRNEREEKTDPPWKPSIFMPRWASRATLEITEVRLERLQEITESDALAEGVLPSAVAAYRGLEVVTCRPAGFAYRDVWIGINGVESWDANGFVWALTFRRMK